MRSMQWQLGILGTISAFAYRHRETEKNCVEMAGRRTFRILTSSQQSGVESKNNNTHVAQQASTNTLYDNNTHNYNNTYKTTKQQFTQDNVK